MRDHKVRDHQHSIPQYLRQRKTPSINLTRGHCDWSTGDPNCTRYGFQIARCQYLGVKIFLSLGGDSDSYSLSSTQDANQVAYYLWTYYVSGQKPCLLGHVKLDGIDFHIERAIATGLFDYIWVQFYNNPYCEYTDDGDTRKLISSWNQWTATFTATKFYVGLPESTVANGRDGGYVPIDVLNSRILPALKSSSKFGGFMLWNYYYDKISGYSDNINCAIPAALNVWVREPFLAMMESAPEVLYHVWDI